MSDPAYEHVISDYFNPNFVETVNKLIGEGSDTFHTITLGLHRIFEWGIGKMLLNFKAASLMQFINLQAAVGGISAIFNVTPISIFKGKGGRGV